MNIHEAYSDEYERTPHNWFAQDPGNVRVRKILEKSAVTGLRVVHLSRFFPQVIKTFLSEKISEFF